MIPIADILLPEHVKLELKATESVAAIREVAGLLKRDVRVLDWEELHTCLGRSRPCPCELRLDFNVCIPHARSESVSGMVMAVGRSRGGVVFPSVSFPARYVFCIAVPTAMAADYLRIVGLIARVFKDQEVEQQLHAATTASEFIALLARAEARI